STDLAARSRLGESRPDQGARRKRRADRCSADGGSSARAQATLAAGSDPAMRRAAAALSLLVMQCLAKVEITSGAAIATFMHTKWPMNGIRWFGRACLNSAWFIR